MSLVCAIDSQVAPQVAGGTETALLSLISSLGKLDTHERFVLLGLKRFGEHLRPYMGQNQSLYTWPNQYTWFHPEHSTPLFMGPKWRRLRKLSGPMEGIIKWAHGFYAAGQPLGPRAARLMGKLGSFGPLVPPAYRFYVGLRAPGLRPLSSNKADAILRSRGVSVVHFPYPLHFPTGLPFVYEPWGLPHLHHPEHFRNGEPEWMDALFRSGCEDAAMVVTATHWVKQDIVSRYRIPAERIAVIPRLPIGVTESLAAWPDLSKWNLPHHFALFPAMTWPTKNHLGLLRGLARLRDSYGQVLHVVFTGRQEESQWRRIQEQIQTLSLSEQVHFLGPVPFADLQILFRTARFLVFPSVFEGLGLPLLEAFHYGLPVVASRAACIPEVVGDAAILFDPTDDDSIAQALRKAIREPDLLTELGQRGSARLREHFPSHETIANMFISCYRHAAGATLNSTQQRLLHEITGRS